MRLIRLVVLMLVALLPSLSASRAVGAPGWVTFTHPDPPFAIQYPGGWVRLSADKVALLVLVDPETRGLGLVVVGVRVGPGENAYTLEPRLPQIISRSFSDYRPLRTDRTVLNGRPAIVHYFTGVRSDVRVYVMLGAVATNAWGFVLYGTTTVDSPRLREELGLLQRIIAGFRPGR
jgi:hypothetical protein